MLAIRAESCYQQGRLYRRSIVALLAVCAHPLFGGVVLDGSFGTKGALPGPNFMITAPMGKQFGGNLFQSFSQFNLNSSQTATFTGPPNVHNILARVTSGSPSSIDGAINSDIRGANLFFMNPAGVLFGQHAQLNVSGSFAVTTANYLKLVGGGRFNANLGGGDMLTSAPVSSFGFLNQTPAGISISGSNAGDRNNIIPGPGFRVASGKSFSIVAGNVAIDAGYIAGEGARVNLVSVQSPGEVQLDATNINSPIDLTQFTALGTINLTNLSLIDTSGPGGGPVVIRSGSFSLDNGRIASETVPSGPIQGGGIDISANSILIQNSSISTVTNGSGNGGDVRLTAQSLLSLRGGRIYANTGGSGKGGNVTLTAKSLVIDDTIEQNSVIESSTTFGTGRHNAGNLALTADSLLIRGTSTIDSNTFFSSGNAGNVTLTANSLVIQGNSKDSKPVIESIAIGTLGDGNGGNITVNANSVSIGPFATIAAQTLGDGDGGNVALNGNSVLIGPFTAILAQTRGTGDAGSIFVNAGTLQVSPNGFISTSTFASSGGGNITIVADSVLIDGTGELKEPSGNFLTGIFSQAEGQNFQHPGKGGDITVTANDLMLQDGGAISAESFVSSAAGSVRLDVGTLRLESSSAVSSANTGSGEAGSVIIDTNGPVKLKHGSSISTASAMGDAGSIDINSGGIIKLSGDSSITVSAGHNGGDIHITAPDLVYLLNSSITATAGASGVSGAGGNVIIDPQFIVLNNSLISANAAAGQGGNINLISDFFFNSNSSITATGTTNGTVNITAPALDLGSELITLPTSLLSAQNQLQERCTALLYGDFSSFISIGRGGTEPAPEELQTTF